MTSTDPVTASLRHEPEADRYVLSVDGTDIGVTDYVPRDDVLDVHHTEIVPSYEGRGFGNRMVELVLADVRDRGLRVRPTCSFVRAYVRRHPETGDLVAA
jgi:predicted GNAT family acetyltransferase